ncbi:MAG: CapA family protein [Erysipelotrichaceae bacterium]
MKSIIIFIVLLILSSCSNKTTEVSKGIPNKELKQEMIEVLAKVGRVHVVGVGDNLIHGPIADEADKFEGTMGDGFYNFNPMYEKVANDIKSADIAYLDQETILGGDYLGISGYPCFNTPKSMAKTINDLGFDLINQATNHALDRGEQGIINSIATFKEYPNMITAGIYDSQASRDTIKVIERNGIKIAFLAYTYGTNGIQPPNSYNVSYFNESEIRNDVAKAKEVSDVIIVSAHWGDENTNIPNSYQTKYAQLLADLDVDVVIGEHPHVIQPITTLKGINGNETLIVYSLGNFLGGMLGVDNNLSGMINFDIVKSNNDFKIENIFWTPLVIHYEGNSNDIMDSRHGFKVYKLADYTNELAAKHALNGYENQSVTLDYLNSKTKEVIDSKYLK